MSEAVLRVDRVGAHGDGVATQDGKPVYIPFAAPGDLVRVRLETGGRAAVIDVLEPGARRPPPCPHFGVCGGCALQHLDDNAYRGVKENTVREAMARRGLDPATMAPLQRIAPATRRRARLALVRKTDGTVEIGFRQRGSHRIVDMHDCLVLHPRLFVLVPALRQFAVSTLAPRQEQSATLTLTANGVDLVFEVARAPDLGALEAMAAFAEAQDLARLSWTVEGEAPTPVVQRRAARIAFAGVTVDVPPDSFLQASAEGEAKLTELVLAGIGAPKRIADLFCGVGTFSFALAKVAGVHAFDGEKNAVAALAAAARRAGLDGRVTAACRDLECNPLRPEEFDGVDAVAFDPPYAGAQAQAKALARSKVGRVVALSCNPASFARDARILVEGGFRLTRVTPVDLFVWSAEIELVAWFER